MTACVWSKVTQKSQKMSSFWKESNTGFWPLLWSSGQYRALMNTVSSPSERGYLYSSLAVFFCTTFYFTYLILFIFRMQKNSSRYSQSVIPFPGTLRDSLPASIFLPFLQLKLSLKAGHKTILSFWLNLFHILTHLTYYFPIFFTQTQENKIMRD